MLISSFSTVRKVGESISLGIIVDIIISQYVNVWWMTLKLINIGSIWPSYPNSLVYVKYFLGCIVCISRGYLNLIWFILAHVICTCNSCPCFYALIGEIKVIYIFIYTQLKSILVVPFMAVTEVYWWDMSGATMYHDIGSGTVQGVSLGHAPKHSNDSPGAFH